FGELSAVGVPGSPLSAASTAGGGRTEGGEQTPLAVGRVPSPAPQATQEDAPQQAEPGGVRSAPGVTVIALVAPPTASEPHPMPPSGASAADALPPDKQAKRSGFFGRLFRRGR